MSLEAFSRDYLQMRDRTALARRYNLTPAQVSAHVREAMDLGFLDEDDKIKPGRPRLQP